MYVIHSNTADLVTTYLVHVITPDVKDNMKEVLKDIQMVISLIALLKITKMDLKNFMNYEQHGHEIEAVGRELRKHILNLKAFKK